MNDEQWVWVGLGLWFLVLVAYAVIVAVQSIRQRSDRWLHLLDAIDRNAGTTARVAAGNDPAEPAPKGPYEHKGAYQPAAGRGNFWSTVGTGTELAVDREARELADYELVKQKLAGMNRHPAGKARADD